MTNEKTILDYEMGGPEAIPTANPPRWLLKLTQVAGHWAWWGVTAALFAVCLAMTAWWTPQEASMGDIQKIFYLHLPVAISTFLACLLCFVASIGYLYQRESWWDDLGAAGARVAVQLCAVVLLTGMIWGKSAWGVWWTWSPRLTFSLALFLLYVVYLMVRASIESSQRRAVVSAVYGIVAFLDVPLVYLSTRLMTDIHPTSIELAGEMKLTLGLWFAPVLLFTIGLIGLKFALNRRERKRLARIGEEAERSVEPVVEAKLGGAL